MTNTPSDELYDMSGTTKQMLAAKVVIEYEGQILALHPSEVDKNRRWQMPGGLKDDHLEPLTRTAVREVLEETGIVINDDQLKPFKIGEWTAIDHEQKVAILAVFFHVLLKDEPAISLSDEHDDFVWLNRDNYRDYEANREVYEIVEGLL